MLRVCTWNIKLGLRLDEILEAVSKHRDFQGLDLLALQEASVHGGRPDAVTIASVLGRDYDCHQVAAQTIMSHVQANALIWNRRRIKVEGADHAQLPRAKSGVRPGRVLLAQRRSTVVVEGKAGRHTLVAYSVHLDIFGAAHKQAQLTHVLEDRKARDPADITVVAGDLNLYHLARWPSWSKLIDAYQKEGFVDAARSVRWTHSIGGIRQKLDSILVRSTVDLKLRSWTLPLKGSDHIPLFADLETDRPQ
ncbi:MAG TPA: endonuclease/exonuclease/phosphatase family protein [Candidatus Dormibacteraeota bacterium]|nr:endonuclease/exonuclease/phosphatase family protein [Candidatus Dormibacteraeota bacterium]